VSLSPGARLGAYEIGALIGAGGMGEVYRAKDTRLDRTVAIKVLPESVAGDPHLRERFDREARVISSLNHPHICTLYDIGHEAGVDFLVLEYLEGETLADRLQPGGKSLSVIEAMTCAGQIADALDRAHRSGVVHRDLKPANVMLTKSGAKLLDFGLARTAAPVVRSSSFSMLPTTPPVLTAQGAILGTFQYMAPEQIEGLEADPRTDLFAFGALLFEMLTGRHAFEGKTRAQLLGAILKDEPPAVSTLNPLAPKALDRIVTTCLAKDPDDRWQTARDLMRELKWAADAGTTGNISGPVETVRAKAGSRLNNRVAWTFAGVLGAALIGVSLIVWRQVREVVPVAEAIQFTIPAPENTQFGGPPAGGTGQVPQAAVSPDGRSIVFVAASNRAGDLGYQLWLRPIGAVSARLMAGTENAAFPFWSPDSQSIGFFAGGKLKRVPVSGGPPVVLCDASAGRGGTWNRDNVIVFSIGAGQALQRVSATGGAPVSVSVIDTEYPETGHRWPLFLPDGHHFLYIAYTGACCPASKPARVRIGTLDSKEVTTLMEVEASVLYASGHLLFTRPPNGPLMAQPFDPESRRLTGDAFQLVEQVASEGSRYASVSVSATGVLLYARGIAQASTQLTWIDRDGKSLGTVGGPASFLGIDLGPDDNKIAAAFGTGTPENRDIWLLNATNAAQTRMTFDPGFDDYPVWSPDGLRIVFQGNRQGALSLRQKIVDGTADDELLNAGPPGSTAIPTDWSADGRFIAFNRSTTGTGFSDIWVMPTFGDRNPYPIVQTRANDSNASFSPDGRWFAYQTTETGQSEVYVQPFPPTGGKRQISEGGGFYPTWRADGKELFYRQVDGTLMATTVNASGSFTWDSPRKLFSLGSTSVTSRPYAVATDGKKFLVAIPQSSTTAPPLTVMLNWTTAIPH
jgi:Tol biopolymer transport system component